MAYQFILFDRSEGVGTVTLNRPDYLNAFTPAMLQELLDVFRGMERDPQVRAIVITGAGRAFCGGEDFRQRAESEVSRSQPSDNSSPSYTVNSQPSIAFEGGVNVPYNPTALPEQPGPTPQLDAVFSPLNPGPIPVETNNPVPFQPEPVSENNFPAPQHVEMNSGQSQPLFNEQFQSTPETPRPASGNASPQVILAEQIRRLYNPLIRQIRSIEKPVIAAVNGIAAGTGLGLALACDIRYASERARFVEVSTRVGLVPGGGTGFFLPRLIGLSKTLEMAFNGDELNATEAERLGLISRVYPLESLQEETRKLATRLAKGPTRAIGLTKSMIYRSATLTLEQALDLEANLTEQATRTQDYKEGLQAFLEKRPPNYTGK
ncbi:MAG TPA: enoyl-CoA hydratase-related protein [Chloroflexia bacterium]|nr:enoyl-CoA hydratase-related protein [Chloroflexia bacterium]